MRLITVKRGRNTCFNSSMELANVIACNINADWIIVKKKQKRLSFDHFNLTTVVHITDIEGSRPQFQRNGSFFRGFCLCMPKLISVSRTSCHSSELLGLHATSGSIFEHVSLITLQCGVVAAPYH